MLFIILFILVQDCQCKLLFDCIPIGNRFSDGFNSQTNTSSLQCSFTHSNKTYLFTKDFNDDSENDWSVGHTMVDGQIIFSSNNHQLFITSNLTLTNQSQLYLHRPFEISYLLKMMSQSQIHVFKSLQIQKNISIKDQLETNYPLIISWNAIGIELFKSLQINSNTECFDLLSMQSPYILNTANSINTIKTNDFPYPLSTGHLHLLSGQRLVRYCPFSVPFTNEVKCILTTPYYQKSYSGSGNYAFAYPHCPCNDEHTSCILEFLSSEVYLQSNDLSHTLLHINHNTTLYQLDTAKSIHVEDLCLLHLISMRPFSQNLIKTSFGFITNSGESDGMFFFNPLKNTLILTGTNELHLNKYKNKVPLTIIGHGLINLKDIQDSSVYSFKIDNEKEKFKVHINQKGNNQILIFDQQSYLDESPYCAVVIIKSKNTISCQSCKEGFSLTQSNLCIKDIHCNHYSSNGHCLSCKDGYQLSVDGTCQSNYYRIEKIPLCKGDTCD
ncbi:hypothetical protein EDI_323320 [Entamoeba dispar SAW760]|uniref:Uncharacterized protein n=1 Tax=Entamoeba dispar (strain ATCC PRA-260 / SAW760) TaxID=370354 RepID=B0EPL2_ENTDS|nr:uncharacterized protein EDI_323320 [Entamoeba dispar SAW760]EDR23549.1 hypothetical protein EDI_323320 [Entamoeba dispar SAW760]|eukprot:EDR23549.1 hypothetical protein EDI_323320 [Entamoeba dispar SAW760]